MKTPALLFLAVTLSAAPAPDVRVSPFGLSGPAIGTPPLLLSTPARPSTATPNSTAVARVSNQPDHGPRYVLTSPIDLLVSAADRAKIVDRFRFEVRPPAPVPRAPESAHSGVRYYRFSPTDLIGPASDREKLTRKFQSSW